MSLDALLEPIPDRTKTKEPCKVGRIIQDLDGVYKLALIDLLAKSFDEGGLTDEALTDRIHRAGMDVGETTVRKHRKGTCSCA